MTEHLLTYDHVIAPQEHYWDCGPASAQIVLNGRGIIESEDALIADIGTTVNGTDEVGWVEHSFDRRLPEANYTSVYLQNWPPSADQKEQLFAHIVQSVDGGYGVVINIDVPPNNYPRGVKGSANPSYGGGEVFHYISGMGYDDDPNLRAVWIADPGFRPFGYWVSLDQLVTMIVPKGYCYANVAAVPAPTPAPAPAPAPAAPAPGEPADTLFADVSYFQAPVDDSYPYRVLSIRSNDGTFRDPNFVHNYQWCAMAADVGHLTCFISYFYWRVGSGDVDTHIDMIRSQGGPHPKCVTMIDLESGGNPGGDQSWELNAEYQRLVDFYGGNHKRVIAYANLSDERTMWQAKPGDLDWILAGYGANPVDSGLFKLAHQYTDGQGYGHGLPEGCPPFGNCDMNSADGFSPSQFAAAVGVGGSTTGGWLMALSDAEQAELLDGVRLIRNQLLGEPDPNRPGVAPGWPQLGDHTVVDALGNVRDQLGPWPQLGQNSQGRDRTLVDAIAEEVVAKAATKKTAAPRKTAAKKAPAKAPAKKAAPRK